MRTRFSVERVSGGEDRIKTRIIRTCIIRIITSIGRQVRTIEETYTWYLNETYMDSSWWSIWVLINQVSLSTLLTFYWWMQPWPTRLTDRTGSLWDWTVRVSHPNVWTGGCNPKTHASPRHGQTYTCWNGFRFRCLFAYATLTFEHRNWKFSLVFKSPA